jgi:hypothetical protein
VQCCVYVRAMSALDDEEQEDSAESLGVSDADADEAAEVDFPRSSSSELDASEEEEEEPAEECSDDFISDEEY